MPATPNAARILIVRLSSMGDVIHAMPAVAALRKAHPHAHLAWAVEPAWAPLLGCPILRTGSSSAGWGNNTGFHSPLVDSLHLVPFKQWSRQLLSPSTWRQMRTTRRELAASHYDIAVDMQGSLRSGLTLRWSGAHRLLGEDQPRETIARYFSNERVPHSGAHVIEQDLELAGAIFGETLAYTPPPFPRDANADQWASEMLATYNASRYAVLLPGAGWGSKRWPTERYGEVAKGLRERGFHSFVNVGPGEEQLGQSVVAASHGAATALAATLPQIIALMRRAALCIGGDTGPLHLACALQVPVVGIYGPTDPQRNGPYGTQFRVLRNEQSLRDHARKSQPESGLLTITPGDVLTAVRDLLPLECP